MVPAMRPATQLQLSSHTLSPPPHAGDWGFFSSYLVGSLAFVVLGIGSVNPGILQASAPMCHMMPLIVGYGPKATRTPPACSSLTLQPALFCPFPCPCAVRH